MARPVVFFASDRNANVLVAGIPAAARIVNTLLQTGELEQTPKIVIAVPGGWAPSKWCLDEWARLVPESRLLACDFHGLEDVNESAIVAGEATLEELATNSLAKTDISEVEQRTQLKRLSQAIVKSTGKTSDGVVSRYLNRPISRSISGLLLRIPGMKPIHGTMLTAITGLAMVASLVLGGENGLILGAILFHAASVIDGVDGEIARATKRSSDFGAKLDTITDGIINIAFLCLISLNLWWQDEPMGAIFGLIGLTLLTIGLTALGLRSIAQKTAFTFDAVKHQFRAQPSRVAQALAAVTTRDFYAAAFAVCAVFGIIKWALLAFSVAAGIWLLTINIVLIRTRN